MTYDQYKVYLKYLQEGDNPPNGQNGESPKKVEVTGTVFVKVDGNGIPRPSDGVMNIFNQGPSTNTVYQCTNALNKGQIGTLDALVIFLKGLGKNLGTLSKAIFSGISTALRWAYGILKPVLKHAAAYSMMFMSFICTAVMTVFSGVKNAMDKGSKALLAPKNNNQAVANTNNGNQVPANTNTGGNNNTSAPTPAAESAIYRNYLEQNIKEAIIECKALFMDLSQVTESANLTEAPGVGYIIERYINKMLPKVKDLWKWVCNPSTKIKNTSLVLGITVCTLCIFRWLGVRNAKNKQLQQQPVQNQQTLNQTQPNYQRV